MYIGRPHVLGNPFQLRNPRDEEDRRRVIEEYRAWFLEQISVDEKLQSAVEAVRGRDLGCWCAPRACHGDVIIEWLERNPPNV